MNKTLNLSQVLVFYDVPEIFLATDSVGTQFLCLLVESNIHLLKYIAVAISKMRLHNLLFGNIDLRQVISEPENNEWFVFDEIDKPIIANLWTESQLPEDYLPEPGFIFQENPFTESIIFQEVREKNSAVVHLSLSDSTNDAGIDADNLGIVTKLYQNLVENCLRKSLQSFKGKRKKVTLSPTDFKLRAFASSAGSFNLHLFSTAEVDLFGYSIIEAGLEKFDELTRDVDNTEEYVAKLRSVRGHTISSLKKLMSSLIENELALSHKWFAPSQQKVNSSSLDNMKARMIMEILNKSDELAEVTRILIGQFTQVDLKRGTWRIYNIDDDKEYRGEAPETKLQGVTVKTVTYRVVCQEFLEEFKVSETEKIRYVLESIEPIP